MSFFGCLLRMSSFNVFLFVSSFVLLFVSVCLFLCWLYEAQRPFFLHSGSALPSRIESSLSPAAWLAHFSNVNTRLETSQPERLEPKPPTPYVNKQIPRISQKGHILHYWTAMVVPLVIITCNQNVLLRWASLRCLRKHCRCHDVHLWICTREKIRYLLLFRYYYYLDIYLDIYLLFGCLLPKALPFWMPKTKQTRQPLCR